MEYTFIGMNMKASTVFRYIQGKHILQNMYSIIPKKFWMADEYTHEKNTKKQEMHGKSRNARKEKITEQWEIHCL
jgi:hypothetical protein